VILVLAAAGGASAPSAAALAPLEAEVVSLEELSAGPSTLCDPGFERSELTVSGARIRVGELKGVVNLVPAMPPELLTFYAEEEREYQAGELHAWLSFFLSSLRCRVVNRPTPVSLTGPALTALSWTWIARAAGVAAVPLTADSRDVRAALREPTPDGNDVVCVGGRVVSPTGSPSDASALRLAESAGVVYLRAWFDHDSRLLGATSVPDLRPDSTRRALADYLA
jgi:hypothetical protein